MAGKVTGEANGGIGGGSAVAIFALILHVAADHIASACRGRDILLALQVAVDGVAYQRVEKVLIRQAVQKFQVQGAKKVQGRGVFRIRKSLRFLQRHSNWEIFNSLL